MTEITNNPETQARQRPSLGRRAPRIVVLGGYGHFGTRVSRALARHGKTEIWIAGRNEDRADTLARTLDGANASVRAARLDVTDRAALTTAFDRLGADIVIHTAGPFQARDYGVAEACIDAGCHYLDLADGRRFVADFDRLDTRAKAADVLLVSGASTLPGLSSAVVDLLRNRMARIHSIETSIVPAGQTPRGRATIAAVLGYCGKPVHVFENGAWTKRHGWQDARRVRYPAFSRRVAVCDVPDLELFPAHYGVTDTVGFRAGPESRLEQLALSGMAWATRLGLVDDWSRYGDRLARIGRWTARFGTDTGGMQVRVRGTGRDGEPIERCWDLTARSNHGPEIPCMPAIALAKKLAAGEIGIRGAVPCIGLIGVEDFAVEAQGFDIDWNLTRVT